ncbi:MAG: ABC transporter permease, partial [Candidatus Rokuibacteriota bacterium]
MAFSTPASGTSLDVHLAPAPTAAATSSLYRDALRRLARNRLALAGGVIVLLILLVAIFADALAPLP